MQRARIDWAWLFMACAWPAFATTQQWEFRVYLDDKPIGWQRFTLQENGDAREVNIEAQLQVQYFGITFYRYRHNAQERWQRDCLRALSARTDDNGKQFRVDSELEGDTLVAITPSLRIATNACPMSFAYWNPDILAQSRLLNSQTGAYENVRVDALGASTIRARGSAIDANHYRISGLPQPIDLWYSPNGQWLGLESRVSDGKRLRYELQ